MNGFPIFVSCRLKWAAVATALLAVVHVPASFAEQGHLAVNLKGDFEGAHQSGFDLADVASLAALEALPEGMRGVFWLGNGYNTQCSWRLSDEEVVNRVTALKGNPKFSGIYYISDEPHPANCPDAAQRVGERSDLIRQIDPSARTFIVIQNSSRDRTEFAAMKDAADYIGVAPYPCNRNNIATGCDLKALTQRIDEAIGAGIIPERIVPVFQLFGQECTVRDDPYYRLPSVAELEDMLAVWDERVPRGVRPFDMAYSWGVQERTACPALSQADGTQFPALRDRFAAYLADRYSLRQSE